MPSSWSRSLLGRASCDTLAEPLLSVKCQRLINHGYKLSLQKSLHPRRRAGTPTFLGRRCAPRICDTADPSRVTHVALFGRSVSIRDIFLNLVTGSLAACQRVLIGSSVEELRPEDVF